MQNLLVREVNRHRTSLLLRLHRFLTIPNHHQLPVLIALSPPSLRSVLRRCLTCEEATGQAGILMICISANWPLPHSSLHSSQQAVPQPVLYLHRVRSAASLLGVSRQSPLLPRCTAHLSLPIPTGAASTLNTGQCHPLPTAAETPSITPTHPKRPQLRGHRVHQPTINLALTINHDMSTGCRTNSRPTASLRDLPHPSTRLCPSPRTPSLRSAFCPC